MYKDPGKSYSLGFGVNTRRDLPQDSTERAGQDPNSSFIAKSLHEHPVLKFLAASTATVVGMHFAGKVIQGEGLKLVKNLMYKDSGTVLKHQFAPLMENFRSLQRTLDDWEGVFKLNDGPGGTPGTRVPSNAFFSPKDKQLLGEGKEPIAAWGFRQDIQQKMVRQARRLPYELPAAYIAQKAPGVGTDAIFGYGDDGDKVNWASPVDVVGDFAQQSVKNLASFMLPIEVGGTAIKAGWNKILTYADQVATPEMNQVGVNLGASLRLVGHSAGEILHNMVRYSGKTSAAMGQGISEAVSHSRSIPDTLREMATSSAAKGHKAFLLDQIAVKPIDNKFLDLFQPAGGMRHFVRGFQNQWERSSQQFANLDAFRLGLQDYNYKDSVHKVNADLAHKVSGGHSLVEQISSSLVHLIGPTNLVPDRASMRNTPFYKSQMDKIYQDHIVEALGKNKELDEASINKVVNLLTVKRRPDGQLFDSSMPLSERFSFGNLMGDRDYRTRKDIKEAMTKILPAHGKTVETLFKPGGALAQADRKFANSFGQLENQIYDKWNVGFREFMLPTASKTLGQSKLPNELFDDLSHPEVKDFLVRNTAAHISRIAKQQGNEGIDLMRGPIGMRFPRDIGDIAGDLKRLGIDTSMPEQMRDFLMHQGVIARAGSREGFNALGMRRLSVEDALSRNYFGKDLSPSIERLTQEMTATSEFGRADWLRRTSLGGNSVWETQSGRIIDAHSITGGFRRVYESFSDQFQFPFIHINPAKTFGSEVKQQQSQVPFFQVASGRSLQPFAGAKGDTEAWLFARTKRSGKGKLARIVKSDRGIFGTEAIAGEFKSGPSDGSSMLGRHLRLTIGNKGQIPDDPRQGLRKAFSVDEDQQGSFFRLKDRIKAGRTWSEILHGKPSEDIRNPAVYARKLQDGSLRALQDSDPRAVAEAGEIFERSIKAYGFKPRVVEEMLNAAPPDSEINRIFRPVLGGRDPVTGKLLPGTPISEVRTKGDVLDISASIDRDIAGTADKEIRDQKQWAKDTFMKRHIEASTEFDNYLDRKSGSQTLRKKGVFRRIEEFRADYARFNSVVLGLEDEAAYRTANENMLGVLDDLKAKNKISKSEHTEGRAAILSYQISFDSIRNYKASSVRQARILNTMNTVGNAENKEILKTISNYGLESGKFAKVKSAYKKVFGAADYQYEGIEYNPFGGQNDSVFIPTLSTALKRNKLATLKSVAGYKWDPEGFSGASIPVAHGFQRLNSFLSAFSGGLDETDFGGPLGFYVKGLVGKRVFPIVAGGTAALAADRTLGGFVNDKDQYGERNYSPLLLSGVSEIAAHGQTAAAGIVPGGQTAADKKYELDQGEVPIRKGRYWPLGNTPWKGGRIQYYRPSWKRRVESGYMYTKDAFGSPMEKLLYGDDFSPLRPFDPYRFERKHQSDRPYPVTGDYFTGPWGPLTGALNATIGRVLKPPKKMHQEEVAWKLSQYQQVGERGMAPSGTLDPTAAIPTTGTSTPAQQEAVRNVESFGGNYRGDAGGPSSAGAAVMGEKEAMAAADRWAHGGAGRKATPRRPGERTGGSGVGGGGGPGFAPTGARGAPTGSGVGMATIAKYNEQLMQRANEGSAYQGVNSQYGVTTPEKAFTPKVIAGGPIMDPNSLKFKASDIGYRAQELAGIYGFSFGAIRSSLGMGNQDMSPERPVLATPNKATGMSRNFWDLSFGGFGDFPSPLEGENSNIEISEIVRRFLARERSDIDYLNPISNDMGKMYPWLPGSEYMTNFKEGDPYTAVPMGEGRLPGIGYTRFNKLHPDMAGQYGTIDQFKILGDVAPYSAQYKQLDKSVDKAITTPADRQLVDTIRYQVSEKAKEHEFKPYEYKGADYTTRQTKLTAQIAPGVFQSRDFDSPIKLAGVIPDRSDATTGYLNSLIGKDVSVTYDKNKPPLAVGKSAISGLIKLGDSNVNKQVISTGGYETEEGKGLISADGDQIGHGIRGVIENLAHRDTYFNTKFLPHRTANEEWERQHVYGATFPQWQHPIQDFLKPAIYKGTNRGPIISAIALGTLGNLFSPLAHGKAVGTLVGATVGFGAGIMQSAGELERGTRFIPEYRKKELAVEENIDILSYIKNMRLKNQAEQMGDQKGAQAFQIKAQHTMYGADLRGDPKDMIAAVPNRKRPYFEAFLKAPKQDRARILSTAGRLERRMLESAWGMKIEKRPDLGEYFDQHELPAEDWGGWSPDVDMDNVKIKVAQHIGLDVSQMGYYPQQVRAANAINIPYPDIQSDGGRKHRNVQQELQSLLMRQGVSGSVRGTSNGTGSNQIMLNAGVR